MRHVKVTEYEQHVVLRKAREYGFHVEERTDGKQYEGVRQYTVSRPELNGTLAEIRATITFTKQHFVSFRGLYDFSLVRGSDNPERKTISAALLWLRINRKYEEGMYD